MSFHQGILPPPMRLDNDAPRARRDDPTTSHAAADRSQSTRAHVKLAVLVLVDEQGPVSGNHLNDLYQFSLGRPGFLHAHFDSPRKRAGELEKDGLLAADRANGREARYSLTGAGREFLAAFREVAR